MSAQIHKIFSRALIITAFLFTAASTARAGYLYALNERAGLSMNLIYGFSVNETTGALVLLPGFPISSGGVGSTSGYSELMAVDAVNSRLYVINGGSSTLSGFSINSAGALTPLPFSPMALAGGGPWDTVTVHPSGSPLFVGNGMSSQGRVLSFLITPTTATPAVGNPFSTLPAVPFSSTLSRDGNFLHAGGNSGTSFAGFSVNRTTGTLTLLPGSPFDSGASFPGAYSSDAKGRLFAANPFPANQLRSFTTVFGIPMAVTGNPFSSGLPTVRDSQLHPNERFLYVSDIGSNRIGIYQIAGDGAGTTLTPLATSPVDPGGIVPRVIAINSAGTFLFAGNSNTRNISTLSVNASTGALTLGTVQPVDSIGTSGIVTGMGYLPNVLTVSNTNNAGPGSLRQAVLDANAAAGGVIVFEPIFYAVPNTIELDSGQITIQSNVQIVGPGAHLLTVRNTAPPSFTSRVFNIPEVFNIGLNGMTVTGGNPDFFDGSGGISNYPGGSILTISDCIITGNTSAGPGGAIRNVGVLNLINSTVSRNTSTSTGFDSGGIDSTGTMFVTNSTISGNVKTSGGGGGGIWTNNTTVIVNSTITGNFAGNAGGIHNANGNVTIRNSIVAGNRFDDFTPDVVGDFDSRGFNIIGNVGTATGFNQPGDQSGTGAAPLDPRLVKVLAFRGGTTPTHALLPTSPAIDKGNNSNYVTDQRWVTRPFDNPSVPNTANGADIGAFERRALESIHTAPFDFDGDGKTDIGISRANGGVAEWWINRSSTGVTFALQFGASTDLIAPADYTGDGKADIAFFRPSSGEWYVLRSEDFSFFALPFGTNGDVPVPADYDADGKADFAVMRPSTSTWFISQSSGAPTRIFQFGIVGDQPVVSDYDGDGKADVAIFRPGPREWWIQRSTAGLLAMQFGNAADKAVQGDYTGDGKSDVAIWRPSTGEWFIARSEDFSFYGFPFGANGDIPSPGDYDGDGKFDATVFRPSSATWFIGRTTAGTQIVQFGANGDRPIANAFVP